MSTLSSGGKGGARVAQLVSAQPSVREVPSSIPGKLQKIPKKARVNNNYGLVPYNNVQSGHDKEAHQPQL